MEKVDGIPKEKTERRERGKKERILVERKN